MTLVYRAMTAELANGTIMSAGDQAGPAEIWYSKLPNCVRVVSHCVSGVSGIGTPVLCPIAQTQTPLCF